MGVGIKGCQKASSHVELNSKQHMDTGEDLLCLQEVGVNVINWSALTPDLILEHNL